MIPDRRTNRVLVRSLVGVVALLGPMSILLTILLAFFQSKSRTVHALRIWFAAETLFWIFSKIRARLPSQWESVAPTPSERAKLREDAVRILGSSPEGVRRFIEGWFLGPGGK